MVSTVFGHKTWFGNKSWFGHKSWRQGSETLLFGAIGGSLLGWYGMPAGYLTGALFAVAAAALAGRQLSLPSWLTHIASAAIGTTLGSAISPSMLHGMGTYPVSLTILLLSTIAVIAASASYLRVVHKWDPLSAMLAATPGALSQISLLAIQLKADFAGVAIAQIMRVVVMVAVLPLVLALSGFAIGNGGRSPIVMAAPPSLALLVVVSLAVGYLLFRLRVPGGWMFGTMLGSGLLHGFGAVEGGLPPVAVSLAMIGIGSIVGTRFTGLDLKTFVSYFAAGIGSLAVALTVMFAFLMLDHWLVGVRIQDAAMSFAPGGMDVMMTASLTMHLDPLFIGAHHLARFLGVSLAIPFMVRRAAPKTATPPEEQMPETEI